MQIVMAQSLRAEIPESVIEIASPFPTKDKRFYSPIRVIRSRRRNLLFASIHLCVLLVFRFFRARPGRYRLDAEIDAMTRADLVIDLSGDMLTEDYGLLVAWSHYLPLLQAVVLGQKLAICAQSIGPFKRLRFFARLIFKNATYVSLRERKSLDVVSSLGLPIERWELTADLAFLLPTATDERVDEILVNESIPQTGKKRLGVCISALLANATNRNLQEASSDLIHEFAAALDFISMKHDLDVILVPHVYGPKPVGDDRLAARRLAEYMRVRVHQLKGEYCPDEIKGIIARCHAFVGCRMHANIAALDSGVPVLAIGYSHKTVGIMAEFDKQSWVLPVNTLDATQLSDSINRLIADVGGYKQHLKLSLPAIRDSARQNVEAVLKILSSGSQT